MRGRGTDRYAGGRLPDARVEGVDASASMLSQAWPRAHERLSYRHMDVNAIEDFSPYDLVFSNAALHWIPDNERLVTRIVTQLRPGAQVAIQIPRGGNTQIGDITRQIVELPQFQGRFTAPRRGGHALTLERYSQILYDHGFRDQVCIAKVYGHELAHTTEVIEFLKGSGLGQYLAQLDEAGKAEFVAAYRERLLAAVGEKSPFFYQMTRMLFWGQKG
ncbi:MAG: methyltransferase domain-containing protein [Dehalococcoidia bacterium]